MALMACIRTGLLRGRMICGAIRGRVGLVIWLAIRPFAGAAASRAEYAPIRSEEHTSELQSLMRISYAVFCLKKKKNPQSNSVHQSFNQSTASLTKSQTLYTSKYIY